MVIERFRRVLRLRGVAVLLAFSALAAACSGSSTTQTEAAGVATAGEPAQAADPTTGATDAATGAAATEPAATSPPETETVSVGIAIPSFAWLPIYVADDLGFFAEQGIAIDEVTLAGGSEAVSALLSGDIDAIATSGSHPLFLHAEGQELVHLVALLNRFGTAVVVSNDVEGERGDITALEGRTVGVSRPGSGGDQIVRSLLTRAGLDPASDVDIIAIGDTEAQISALQSGQVHAIVQTEPVISLAEHEGWGTALVDFRRDDDLFGEFSAVPSTTVQVLPEFITERRELAERFTTAIIEAHCVIQERPDDAIPAAQAVFPDLDEEVIRIAIASEQAINGAVYSEEGHAANVAFFREAGLAADVPYEDVVPPADFRSLWESDAGC